MSDSDRQRGAFEEVFGYWSPECQQLFAASPRYFEAYLNYAALAYRNGVLPPKVREFIHITLNASVTHLFEPALRIHIASALRCGATEREILEVFQLVSVLGMHSMMFSMPILLEEAKAAGHEIDLSALSPDQQRTKEDFTRSRGFWLANYDAIVALAPDYMGAHERLGSVALCGVIEPKVKQLILTAVDASATHLWSSGVRTHIRAAFKEGASVQEIVEVLKIVSTLGTQSALFGVAVLNEVASAKR